MISQDGTSLNIAESEISESGLEEIISIIQENPNLTTLRLEAVSMTDTHLESIAEAFEENRNITTLSLEFNLLTDESAKTITSILSNSSIEKINLSGNGLSDKGATEILEFYQSDVALERSITHIFIEENPDVSDQVLEEFNSLNNPTTDFDEDVSGDDASLGGELGFDEDVSGDDASLGGELGFYEAGSDNEAY